MEEAAKFYPRHLFSQEESEDLTYETADEWSEDGDDAAEREMVTSKAQAFREQALLSEGEIESILDRMASVSAPPEPGLPGVQPMSSTYQIFENGYRMPAHLDKRQPNLDDYADTRFLKEWAV